MKMFDVAVLGFAILFFSLAMASGITSQQAFASSESFFCSSSCECQKKVMWNGLSATCQCKGGWICACSGCGGAPPCNGSCY